MWISSKYVEKIQYIRQVLSKLLKIRVSETPAILKAILRTERVLSELKGYASSLPSDFFGYRLLTFLQIRNMIQLDNQTIPLHSIFLALGSEKEQENESLSILMGMSEKQFTKGRETRFREHNSWFNNYFGFTTDILRKHRANPIVHPHSGTVKYLSDIHSKELRRNLHAVEISFRSNDEEEVLLKTAILLASLRAMAPFRRFNSTSSTIFTFFALALQKEISHLPLVPGSPELWNKQTYSIALMELLEGKQVENWIYYVLRLVEDASLNSLNILKLLKQVHIQSHEEAVKLLPGAVYTPPMIDLLFEWPYAKAKHFVEAGLCNRQTASVHLKELERIGLLQAVSYGREKLYLNLPIYNLLNSKILV
jgi:hypothetical protein